jgi:hypothetical protein
MRKQKAWVLAIDANAACIKATWDRCKSYEDYCAAETRNIVINETALLDRLLKYMPDNQYIGGDFKERFDPSSPLSMADLQIPASTAIFKWARPKRAIAELSEAAEDALMEKDRFKIVPIQGLPSLRDASTDVVAGNHDRTLVPEHLEETYEPGRKTWYRSLAQAKFASGAAEAGEIDRHRAQTSDSDVLEHRLPDAALIGVVKEENQGAAFAGRQIADRHATDVDSLSSRHRTILFTWSLPSPTAS